MFGYVADIVARFLRNIPAMSMLVVLTKFTFESFVIF